MRKIRDILRLRYEAGLAYRGIANALNIGYGTVVDYLIRPLCANGWSSRSSAPGVHSGRGYGSSGVEAI